MDASQAEVRYGEGTPEVQTSHPVVEQARQAFDAAQKEVAPQSVYEARREAFQKVVDQVPPDQRNGINVKINNFWDKVGGRVDDVSSRVVGAIKDYNPFALAYRGIGKLRGVDVPTGQYQEERKAKIRGATEIKTEKMKQRTEAHQAFKDIVPGGKVLNITDRIFGPSFRKL